MLCFRKNRLKLGSAQTGHRRIERGSKELEIPVEIPKYNICFRMSDLREFELANRTWEEQIEHGIRTDKPPADKKGSKRKRLRDSNLHVKYCNNVGSSNSLKSVYWNLCLNL